MSDYSALKATIDANITDNGHGDITGPVLNEVLNEMVDVLGEAGGNLSGYVSVPSVQDLPEVGEPTLGYLVGTDLYVYVGTGGDTLDGKYKNCGPFRGPAGPQGENAIGFEDVASQEDGTMVITLSDGNTITIDLNHDHTQYPKYQLLASEAEYEALTTKDSDTLYLIPEV